MTRHGPDAVFNFSGLEHGLPLTPDELPIANDFMAPALYFDRFRAAALDFRSLHVAPQLNEAPGVGIGKRRNQDRVDNRENGRVRADAECKRNRGD